MTILYLFLQQGSALPEVSCDLSLIPERAVALRDGPIIVPIIATETVSNLTKGKCIVKTCHHLKNE